LNVRYEHSAEWAEIGRLTGQLTQKALDLKVIDIAVTTPLPDNFRADQQPLRAERCRYGTRDIALTQDEQE